MTHAYSPVDIVNYQWNNPDWYDLDYRYRVTLCSHLYTHDLYRSIIERNNAITVSISTVIYSGKHTITFRMGTDHERQQFYCDDVDWLMIAKFSDCGQELLARIESIECRRSPLTPYDPGWMWASNHLPTMG